MKTIKIILCLTFLSILLVSCSSENQVNIEGENGEWSSITTEGNVNIDLQN